MLMGWQFTKALIFHSVERLEELYTIKWNNLLYEEQLAALSV